MAERTKRPAFQFYPGDWRRDPALQACSVPARGLWIEMMCLMHESGDYGVLTINNLSPSVNVIARLVGASAREVTSWLSELESNGVFSRDQQGRIFSRRMVNDERVRNARAEGGKEGKEFGERGAEHGQKGGRPTAAKEGLETPLITPLTADKKPPPSSSSSVSSSHQQQPCASNTDALDGFPSFWLAYPKKKSKGDAEKAWRKIKPDEHLQNRIHQALEQAKKCSDWLKENGQFVPYPASWLNAKRWEDEQEAPRADIYRKA